ncbi:MAG: gamma-glutamyltransferase, partial [Phycisphaerales bacterium]
MTSHNLAALTIGLTFLASATGCQTRPGGGRSEWPTPPEVLYRHAAVASDHPIASEAGAEMLARGGNAVDAAVAASFALSVVRPYSCGIGGGGFMVIAPGRGGEHQEPIALDYRETAAAAVGPDYYVNLDDEYASRYGVHASGVPGTVAGLLYALEHYGTLDRATVLAPAIRAASEGFAADASHLSAEESLSDTLIKHPLLHDPIDPIWRMMCLNGDVRIGDKIRNPDQARALQLIADHGADAFYRGPIAEAIVTVMEEGGGPITREDLAGYRVNVVKPLVGTFGEYEVVSMPPPSSGGVAMQQILGILDRRREDLEQSAHNSPQYVHLLAEAMKHAFADRATWLADPAFVDVPIDDILDPAYLDRLAGSIDLNHTGDPLKYGSTSQLNEDAGTSHLSVIDSDGMAVACTETINLGYGSLITVPGFGFALNDEMDDFTTIPGAPNAFKLRQSDRNLPAPGKRPLSSMSPTIVMRDGR